MIVYQPLTLELLYIYHPAALAGLCLVEYSHTTVLCQIQAQYRSAYSQCTTTKQKALFNLCPPSLFSKKENSRIAGHWFI